MALVRESFMEAKRLSGDNHLRESKQFQDALQVLTSNKDTFLKFLNEPNSLFSQDLYKYNLQPGPPPPDTKRITILKPSKLVDNKSGSDILFSPEICKIDDNRTHPTRIVVLKPSSLKPHNLKVVSSSTSHDETQCSSVLSNGYIGDDNYDYATGNLSESEVVSPASRHSWDYINRFNSQYSASSSRASYCHELSVCKEAKKRLSERWAIMSIHENVLEQREVQRSSSTLGDMLALADLNKSVKPDDNDEICGDKSSRNVLRSKSVPARLGVKVQDDAVKEKLVKSSSFKCRVSSLFFTKSKKSCDKSHRSNDGPHCARCYLKNVSDERFTCTGDMVIEEASCSTTFGNHIENQDQPSPSSVLDPQFEEDDPRINRLHGYTPHQHGTIEPMKYNLIYKSPPIGSISRTLLWEDSVQYSSKPSFTPLNPEEEEEECLFYVETLLSVAGVNKIKSSSFLGKWHSPESPLDPSLRDKYMNLSEKEPISSRTKLRHHRAITKLVFDCVNKALVDIAGYGPYSGARGSMDDMVMSSMVLMDRVWGQIKGWMLWEERGDWNEVDGGGMVMVREVVGRGWVEGFRVEIDNIRKEIERRLLEELVQEFVLELTGRVC
ncbi:uncharacterized protein LOC143560866 [Bidens hawaiensis]|uniref:uncharacterized protein LOC143560866 n=1 Tax=Bidens hawaiensis TaxID=980011 RepID=UPI00404A4ECE